MGDNAITALLSVDRVPTGHRNILGVILNQDNGFYKLGTKPGTLHSVLL